MQDWKIVNSSKYTLSCCTNVFHRCRFVLTYSVLAFSVAPFIDIARIVRGIGSVKRHGVRPSVSPIHPLQRRAAGLLLGPLGTGDIDLPKFSSFGRRTPLLRVCCCGPGGQKIFNCELVSDCVVRRKKTNFKKNIIVLISIVFSSTD